MGGDSKLGAVPKPRGDDQRSLLGWKFFDSYAACTKASQLVLQAEKQLIVIQRSATVTAAGQCSAGRSPAAMSQTIFRPCDSAHPVIQTK